MMDELHKPLGTKSSTNGDSKPIWIAALLGCAGLLSLGAYIFIDSKPQKTVVAIDPADKPNVANKPVASLNPVSDGQEVSILDENGNLDLTKVKPLSPLEPIDNEDGAVAVQAPVAPSFQPRPAPVRRLSSWVPMPDLIERSKFGPLPKISDGRVRPLDVYSTSSGTIGANRVALIVGGLGLSQTGTQKAIADLPSEITLGFSPFGNSLQRWMQAARREGHEVVLQIPMEPLGYPTIDPGPRTLTSKASVADNTQNLHWSLARMTNYPLVMNYLGAGMSNKPDALLPMLNEIKRRGLGYIDDGSVSASTAIQLARDIKLPHARGSLVLDKSRNPVRMKAMLNNLEAISKRSGIAIGTATAFPESIKVIQDWAKEASKRGIIIVPASNLLKDYGDR